MSDFTPLPQIPSPTYRKLRVFAIDPALALQVDRLNVSVATIQVRWSDWTKELVPLPDGRTVEVPASKYFEIIDFDPVSGAWYPHLNLSDDRIANNHGLDPSEADPRFHQQMVYAVATMTVETFESALGRHVLWSQREYVDEQGQKRFDYVEKLRIYPHALRVPNAYYDPDRKALLFGYFPSGIVNQKDGEPGYLVFSCLSFDIIAHETTHAILDGIHEHFIEDTNLDVLAFHEGFSDIVALFQRFSMAELLRHQIAETRGDFSARSLLAELAVEFGKGIGRPSSLRDAIGEWVTLDGEVVNERTEVSKMEGVKWRRKKPSPKAYRDATQWHQRGAILVSAVFDAFLLIYDVHTNDLVRLSTDGSGIFKPGNLHPDIVHRLAEEAAKVARRVLQMCIRALDYVAPVDITFGEFLRAIITADKDVVVDDYLGYRVAFIQAFRAWGIHPPEVKSLGSDNLVWHRFDEQVGDAPGVTPIDWQNFVGWQEKFAEQMLDMFNLLSVGKERPMQLHKLLERKWFTRLSPYAQARLLWTLLGKPDHVVWKSEAGERRLVDDELPAVHGSSSFPILAWGHQDFAKAQESISVRERRHWWSEGCGYIIHMLLTELDEKPVKSGKRSRVPKAKSAAGVDEERTFSQHVLTQIFGIEVTDRGKFQVHSVLPSRRTPINVQILARNELVIRVIQKIFIDGSPEPGEPSPDDAIVFRGGCTILYDLDQGAFRFVIRKSVNSKSRQQRQIEHAKRRESDNYWSTPPSLRAIHGA